MLIKVEKIGRFWFGFIYNSDGSLYKRGIKSCIAYNNCYKMCEDYLKC